MDVGRLPLAVPVDGKAERDPLWFKDAIFYQLHVKSFFDANGDGVGDFGGLTQKLDYIQQLGVDTLWLLPFYPSPLKDDGYDIADYRDVHPSYGTMREFRVFVREAHRRGLKVVTELVVNHTSDQHPWFQRARWAPVGSAARNYYVWSPTHERYAGTRIIFTDTEKSNWAWDDAAQAYYWHRFFSHQPDLNFDNPRVVREIISVMRFWLEAGVDGMRLDAVPYLCEREGTNNENLPQTHGVLKLLRKALDAAHPGRIFLAEANQWPEDVLPYFGAGDECHMAFHFPLMPRMFMALAREDRHPITDIMRQTPELPPQCQWAIFLRNHDELTLEMVTNQERDYLWATYATDLRARLNIGIRRRLAPLMDNDRRKIELLNSLLLSMPGTPILYYGDELGMGDNLFLGDRNGVRTPMQWSEDRNGGFSRADPASLYLPPIMDPLYGYSAVNVEAQTRNPWSLLNWMKRLIAVRQGRRTFGRGTLRFIYPANRKVLAYLREYEGDTILCVANLARSAQGAELDLSEFKDFVPVELSSQSPFPPIGALPYFLTLPGYAFYWFHLTRDAQAPAWHAHYGVVQPEPVTIVMSGGWETLMTGGARRTLERDCLPPFLRSQRWFADKDMRIEQIELLRRAEMERDGKSWSLSLLSVRRADGVLRQYFVPMALAWEEPATDPLSRLTGHTIARVRVRAEVGTLFDAAYDDGFALALVDAVGQKRTLPGSDGAIGCFRTNHFDDHVLDGSPVVRHVGGEQSNTSVVVGDRVVIKLQRRPEEGVSPEVEMGRFLTEVAHFANTPPLWGGVAMADATGRLTVLAMLHGFIANQGDAWGWTTSHLERFLDESSLLPPQEAQARMESGALDDLLVFVRTLGLRTGELHRSLCRTTGDPDFDPVPVTAEDLSAWRRRAHEQIEAAMTVIGAVDLPEAGQVREAAGRLDDLVDHLMPPELCAVLTRLHGDFHLGQLLVVKNDVFIIDFEGEPARPLAGRRAKDSPLRDVAGMIRSFDYAAQSTLLRIAAARPDAGQMLEPVVRDWQSRVTATFLSAYAATMRDCPSYPRDGAATSRLLRLFLLEKACYEVCYEAGNRPTWLPIPLRGIVNLLTAQEELDGESQ